MNSGDKVDGIEIRDNEVAKEKIYQKIFKSKKLIRSSEFLTLRARLAFIKL